MTIGIYAGSFDPFTNGHLDIVKRSMKFCNKLIIAIGSNSAKKTSFGNIERMKMIREALSSELDFLDSVSTEVVQFDGLLVNYAKEVNASLLIRGARTTADFEYETNLANINKKLAPSIDTILLPTRPELSIVSSSLVRELLLHKENYEQFVPRKVYEYIESCITKK